MEGPPTLEPKHLFEKRESRDRARLRSYNQLLSQIHHRIFTTSQLPGNPSYLLYTVPPFIIGLPSIDLEDCIVYIVFQLRKGGFEVRFTYPNLLYISWKNFEKEYLEKQNPITKAMTPPPPPQIINKKQKPRVAFSSNVATVAAVAPEPRSAADYTPPSSFLNTMQTPQTNTKPAAKGAGNVLADLWSFI